MRGTRQMAQVPDVGVAARLRMASIVFFVYKETGQGPLPLHLLLEGLVEEIPEVLRDLRVDLSVHPWEYGEARILLSRVFEGLKEALEAWGKAGGKCGWPGGPPGRARATL